MKQRYQLEDADRRAFLKNSLLAFQHLEEERLLLNKKIKEAREQLRIKKVRESSKIIAIYWTIRRCHNHRLFPQSRKQGISQVQNEIK